MKALAARTLLVLALVAALVFSGYVLGVSREKARQNRHDAVATEKAIERHDEAALVGNVVERKTIARVARQLFHTRTLIREVRINAPVNPLVPGCDGSLDPYRMYRWRAANRGAPVDPAGLLDGAAAGGAAATGEPVTGGSDGEPHRGGWDVSRAAGEVSGAGRMGGQD
jgi:hypothetical protein